MKTMCKAQLLDGSWHDAWLTSERAESSYGQPVVVILGEDNARKYEKFHSLGSFPPNQRIHEDARKLTPVMRGVRLQRRDVAR